MESVMISILPKWCGLIAHRKKTVEVRKTKPKIDTPFKCYIYCTEGDALAYPCDNNPRFAIHRTRNGSLLGRQMTAEEREHSDHLYANSKVIGEFICTRITEVKADNIIMAYYNNNPQETCLTDDELRRYANGRKLYYWYIENLVIYDTPKELSEFGLTRPPQSWCYVKELTK